MKTSNLTDRRALASNWKVKEGCYRDLQKMESMMLEEEGTKVARNRGRR
jgi:hypothetical protein